MRVKLGIWDELTRAVIVLLFMAGGLGMYFLHLPLIHQNQRYRKEILELDARIQEQEQIAKHLRASTEALHRDPNTLERLAREKLGYAKSNETVIRFEPPERFEPPRQP